MPRLKNLNDDGKAGSFPSDQYPERKKRYEGETYVVRELVGEDIKELLQVAARLGELPWTKSAFVRALFTGQTSLFGHLA